ncbi:MAG TPA: S41 family peptidase [Kofleriaceae bacterium]|nr:S41 family peptidase [Kofleriaceae bacterium]
MNEWFKAFNAEDYAAIHAWGAAHLPGKPDMGDEGFRAMTGGFEIKRMKDVSPTSVEAIVKEQKSDRFARAQLDVDPKDPNHIVEFHIRQTRPPAEFLTPEQRAARTMDAGKRATVVDAIAKALEKSYVKEDRAKSMAAAIRAHLEKGDYDRITDGEDFATRLTDDLHANTRDLHMRVEFGPHPTEEPPPPPEAAQLEQLRKASFGFGKIERLPGNIARVEILFFPDARLASVRQGIGDLMSQVADADALIVDLRDNGGGDSDTVVFIASYLFDDTPVRLNDIYERETHKTTRTSTHAKVAGKRFGRKKPVFVLTSKATFSGGEDLAYSLQMTKRAIVIGEPTGGGAHPVKLVSIDDQFAIMIPNAESISPYTHGNWEGTGVIPDVKTAADAALDEAVRRATATKP